MGDMKGLRYESVAAMVKASSVTPNMAPKRISFPILQSTGRVLRWTPKEVSSSLLLLLLIVMASKKTNSSTALSTAWGAGGSTKRAHTSAAVPGYCRALIRKTSCSSGTRCTSGACAANVIFSCRCLVNKWTATPSRTRPARPLRCRAFDRATKQSSRDDMRLSGSYRFSFMRPVSTTKATSSIVMAVSAIFVASTTLRTPLGGRVKTRRCSSGGMVE
mmetsp:Transcript_28681/g.61166  ORF Transcript_28681/g.61166 Transcript_28681/m.61166 type:complete len:218 (+) Transcript_28681:1372-2025(+)